MPSPTPFTVDVPDEVLSDLSERLAKTRWPEETASLGWQEGPSLAYVKELVDYWIDRFDWREHEREINAHPQFVVEIDSTRLHFLHVRGRGPDPAPLLLTHGWPSTFYEYVPLIPLLTDPGRFGADPAHSFDVVVPSVPGFGFSDPLPRHEFSRVPGLLASLMTEVLGYERFGAYGGDIGGMITNRLALEYPESLTGVSTAFPAEPYLGADAKPMTPAERAFLERRGQRDEPLDGYIHLGRNQPQLMTFALNDSPAGLVAHIVYFFRWWSECGGDIESVFAKDDLLVNATLYWVSETIASSYRSIVDWSLGTPARPEVWEGRPEVPPGVDSKSLDRGRQIDVPAQILHFSYRSEPREWVERSYSDIRRFTSLHGGGHFGGLEAPRELAEELRAFFGQLPRFPATASPRRVSTN
jgi:pimeloyl-ACP methyl ester carboxylesterase